jgi:sugar phosphate isomerase/epimerase
MAARDLVIPGLGAYRFNLLHPDPATRAVHVRGICELVERAASLGVETVEAVAGSRHPEISYTYAPGNKAPEAWADFLRGAREVCDTCRGTGVRFALEPFIATLLDSPAALRRAVEAIDRPDEIAINFDLVNFASMERCFELNAVVDEVIEAVGPFIALAHLKDIRYDTRPTLHLYEVPPGEGQVDFPYWLRRMQELGRDFPAYIEHLTDLSQMTAAWQYIRTAAREIGAI